MGKKSTGGIHRFYERQVIYEIRGPTHKLVVHTWTVDKRVNRREETVLCHDGVYR